MSDFKANTDDFRDTADSLKVMAAEFEKANENVAVTANAVGNATLEQAVNRFASSWNQHRAELTEQITKLMEHLENGAENIDAMDGGLADSLKGES